MLVFSIEGSKVKRRERKENGKRKDESTDWKPRSCREESQDVPDTHCGLMRRGEVLSRCSQKYYLAFSLNKTNSDNALDLSGDEGSYIELRYAEGFGLDVASSRGLQYPALSRGGVDVVFGILVFVYLGCLDIIGSGVVCYAALRW